MRAWLGRFLGLPGLMSASAPWSLANPTLMVPVLFGLRTEGFRFSGLLKCFAEYALPMCLSLCYSAAASFKLVDGLYLLPSILLYLSPTIQQLSTSK